MSELDRHTPGGWLRGKGASPAAVELMTLGFGAEFGSAASFVLHSINSRGSVHNYRIAGGNDRLPRELATRVDVKYGAAVVAVKQDDRGVDILVRGTETLRADRIVCTLPCPAIGRIFDGDRVSAAKLRAIREQHYSRTVKVFLQTRTRFWLKGNWSGFAETDMPIERLTPDRASIRDQVLLRPIRSAPTRPRSRE